MKIDRICGLTLFVATLAVYVSTVCPTVYWGDGGELAAAVYTLGIAHPTGYPLYCLVGKLWTLVFPFGSIAWRLGIMSAVFGGLAVASLFGFGRCLDMPRVIALTSAALFGFSYTFWQQSIQVETYSMTAFYTCTLLFLIARWRVRGCRPRDLLLTAFVYGLAMTNHQINTLFIPGFVIFVLWTQPALLRVRNRTVLRQWLSTIAVLLTPLLFYLYLPLRASMRPAVDWGHPTTLQAFLFHVSGGYYRRIMFAGSTHDNLSRLTTYARDLRLEYAWVLVALAGAGLIAIWTKREHRAIALLLSWMAAADIVFTINYSIYNGYIYLIPLNAVIAILIGYTLHRAWLSVPDQRQGRVSVIGGAACAFIVALQMLAHWHVSLRNSTQCYDYAWNILSTAPPNAVIVDSNDVAGYPVFLYLQQVEGIRRDVTVVNRGLMAQMNGQSKIANGWVFDDVCRRFPPLRSSFPNGLTLEDVRLEIPLKDLMAAATAAGRPVLLDDLTQGSAIAIDESHAARYDDFLRSQYDVVRIGLVDRLYPLGRGPGDAERASMTDAVWSRYRTGGVYNGMMQRDAFLATVAVDYARAGLARADLACRCHRFDVAARAYRAVLTLFPLQEAADGLRHCEQMEVARRG